MATASAAESYGHYVEPPFGRALAFSVGAHLLLFALALAGGLWPGRMAPPTPRIAVFLPGAKDPSKFPGIGKTAKPAPDKPPTTKPVEAAKPVQAEPAVKPRPIESKPDKPKAPEVKPKPAPVKTPPPKAPEKPVPPKTEKIKSTSKDFDDLLKNYEWKADKPDDADLAPIDPNAKPSAKKDAAPAEPVYSHVPSGEGSGDGVGVSNAGPLDQYYEMIRRHVAKIWKLPPELSSNRALRGEVRVWIDKQGQIVRKDFHTRSSNTFFDSTIELAIGKLTFPPIWFDMGGKTTLEVNLVFTPEIFGAIP